MKKHSKKEKKLLQDKFLEEWEIPDMEKNRIPKEILMYICMLEFM